MDISFHIHVDCVPRFWLITHFMDDDSDFLFILKNQIEKVASETGAIPFDTSGFEYD